MHPEIVSFCFVLRAREDKEPENQCGLSRRRVTAEPEADPPSPKAQQDGRRAGHFRLRAKRYGATRWRDQPSPRLWLGKQDGGHSEVSSGHTILSRAIGPD